MCMYALAAILKDAHTSQSYIYASATSAFLRGRVAITIDLESTLKLLYHHLPLKAVQWRALVHQEVLLLRRCPARGAERGSRRGKGMQREVVRTPGQSLPDVGFDQVGSV